MVVTICFASSDTAQKWWISWTVSLRCLEALLFYLCAFALRRDDVRSNSWGLVISHEIFEDPLDTARMSLRRSLGSEIQWVCVIQPKHAQRYAENARFQR